MHRAKLTTARRRADPRRPIHLATVLGNPVDNPLTPRDRTGHTDSADTQPPVTTERAEYLSTDAVSYSETFGSFVDAADHAGDTVFGWLREQGIDRDAADALGQAGRDFATWLTNHGRQGELKVTIGWEDPRVLIELQDVGTATPDLHHSSHDVALVFRMLLHYVVQWSCDADEQGYRTTRIYGDVTASKTTDSEERL
jgi:hypothetical protein